MSRAFWLDTEDGNSWVFTDPASPFRLRTDPEGLEGAPYGFDDQQNVNQAGVTFRARNDEAGVIGLDVKFGPVTPGSGAQEMVQEFYHSLGRGKQLHTFHSETDFGGDRFQRVRLANVLPPPQLTLARDIGFIQSTKLSLRSDESWWRKRPKTKTFHPADFAGASIPSESDEPVWPHFTLTGPITDPAIGVDGELVALPSIGAGETWTIDTDPEFFSIRDHTGADRTWVGRHWYVRAPAGRRNVPVSITGTGTNSNTALTVVLPQLFWSGA